MDNIPIQNANPVVVTQKFKESVVKLNPIDLVDDLDDEDFYRVTKATTGLNMKEIREIENVFEYFDTNHDGSLTPEQATLAWRTFGIQRSFHYIV